MERGKVRMSKPHDRESNKFKVVVMDYVRARKGDRTVTSTVMWSEKNGFYLNPLFGSNLHIDECDEVEILRKWVHS